VLTERRGRIDPAELPSAVEGALSRAALLPRFGGQQLPGVEWADDRNGRRVILAPRSHPLRIAVEACIRDVYEQAFAGRDLVFPSTLIALLDGIDRPLCAAGLRTVVDGFFSEIYLDRPIEQVLSARIGEPVWRPAIFEVTTLASRRVEDSPAFIRELALLGKSAGFGWCFFTATERLRSLLCQLGFPVLELAAASADRVSDPGRWGSYYTCSPKVCAVSGQWLDFGGAREGRTPTDA
jgi:hypothetical protein